MKQLIEQHVNDFNWRKHVEHNTEHRPTGSVNAKIVEVTQETPQAAIVTVSVDWPRCEGPLSYVATFVGPSTWKGRMVTGFCPEDQPRHFA